MLKANFLLVNEIEDYGMRATHYTFLVSCFLLKWSDYIELCFNKKKNGKFIVAINASNRFLLSFSSVTLVANLTRLFGYPSKKVIEPKRIRVPTQSSDM